MRELTVDEFVELCETFDQKRLTHGGGVTGLKCRKKSFRNSNARADLLVLSSTKSMTINPPRKEKTRRMDEYDFSRKERR